MPGVAPASIALVVNPIAGTAGHPARARQLERAADWLAGQGLDPQVFVTEGRGHARELAALAVSRGAVTVVAWGGDGTVNEVASALVGTASRLAIVPAGSGNGLALGLGLPSGPSEALGVACGPYQRRIDVGEFDGRIFVNIAGVGLDAEIAHQFAKLGRSRRGLLRYAQITVRELMRYRAREYRVTRDGCDAVACRPLLLALANGQQYGNGARIAPGAVIDDGALDLVQVGERSALAAILQVPTLFSGRAAQLRGVAMHRVAAVTIEADAPIQYHIDGEAGLGGRTVHARVRAQQLCVAVPGEAQPTKR